MEAFRRPALPSVLRALAALAVVLAWLGVSGTGGPVFGQLEEVQTTDQAAFLPESAEATRALEWTARFDDGAPLPAVVVAVDGNGLDAAAASGIASALGRLPSLDGPVAGPIPSADGLAAQYVVPLDAEADTEDAVAGLRSLLDAAAPDGVRTWVTGTAGFTADLVEAFGAIDGILLGVALGAVALILLVVYRSVLLPVAVLATAVAALCGSILVVYALAGAGVLALDGQSQGILFILVIGAATDYSLLLVSRHREALAAGASRSRAVRLAWRGSAEPIAASAGTVAAGLLCLLASGLNSNQSLGPIGALGIAFSLLAALSFLPAVLWLAGRAAYWPFPPRPAPTGSRSAPPGSGLWRRVAGFVGRRPRRIWIATALVLAAGCLGTFQLRAGGVPQSDLVLGATESAAGQEALAAHFPGGAGSPATVVVDAGRAAALADAAARVDGVDSAFVRADGGGPAVPGRAAAVVDGRSLVSVTLEDPADSDRAADTVRELRRTMHAQDPGSLVGGPTATAVDTRDTAQADLRLVIPLVLAAILGILMLLLRSVLAPVLLVATTVLSYGTAMGVSALVFNHVLGFPGADPSVPLFGFVFLVALGVDYNIFLMTRVREESAAHGTREGVLRGLAATGGVITSAGVVLAATFAALAVIPIMFLVQLGFIVAFGVLLDTLVVRSLLVPALVRDLGPAAWWPGALWRRERAARRSGGSDAPPGPRGDPARAAAYRA